MTRSTSTPQSHHQFHASKERDMSTKSAFRTRKDTLGFKMIYAAAFAVFLVAAILDRLIPLRWIMGATGSEKYLAILSEAQSAAKTYTPFAFMG
jgi:hypothetical protein